MFDANIQSEWRYVHTWHIITQQRIIRTVLFCSFIVKKLLSGNDYKYITSSIDGVPIRV